jgi:hypothetical protein
MSGTTSVPSPTFGPTGFQAPTEQAILTGVQADINAALGGGVNPALSTPQGQLASSFTAIIADCNDQFLALTQGVDPARATGRMQDGIGRIYFIARLPALPTVVQTTCSGQVNAIIPASALAKTPDGNLWAPVAPGQFGLDGTVSLQFACTATGPVACPAGSLTTIYNGVPGWDTITNPADGVLGQNVETPAQFELRRQQVVFQNSRGTVQAVQAALLGGQLVPGILDAYTTDNPSSGVVVSDGVTIPANALYVCVAGGTPAAVAYAIWTKKTPGCPMAGNTTVVVQDTNSAYSLPYPSYSITFQTAAVQSLIAVVSISNSAAVPSTAATLIQAAFISAFAGTDGGLAARIGSTLHASRFYAGIAALGAWANIINIKLGSTGAPSATFAASIASTVMTVTSISQGVIGIGQTIKGNNLPANVLIVSFGSGSGGTGTYNISLPQTLASQQYTAVAANLDLVAVGIAHVPAIVPADITLRLV